MNESVREHLLGYILGALDEDEHRQLDEQLKTDPRLRAELASLQRSVAPLEADREHHDPPPGLALRTCCRVIESSERSGAEGSTNAHDAKVQLGSAPLRDAIGFRHWNMADLCVAAGIVLASSFLFVPAVAHSRYAAQRTYCQNNLRQLAMAMGQYSEHNRGYFPQIPVSGNRSIAGIVGPILRDGGYLSADNVLMCPSASVERRFNPWEMPTLSEIDKAQGEQLASMQRRAFGSYGYNLGCWVGGRYVGPRDQHRAFFALVSDSPSRRLPGFQSENHGGRGQNVLFEDGHYQYVARCVGGNCVDPLFLNREGQMEPGLDLDDTVIGYSEAKIVAPRRK